MKKNKIAFIFLVLFLGLVAPLSAEITPTNGTVKQRDSQGQIRAILKYKQGHLVRKMLYHDNGQLILDTVFKNGVPIVIKTYYLDGKLKSSWSSKSGQSSYYLPTGARNITVPDK